MRFRLFQYALPADPELPDLNAFLASCRVAAVSHHIVPQSSGGLLLFVVETVANVATTKAGGNPSVRVDYRELLSAEEFATFSRLRTERRRIAEAEGVPVYTIFSNAQLADMVRKRVRTTAALGEIEGVGKARVDKYAPRVLPILIEAFAGDVGSVAEGEA
jgi:superfamily II DNA helicase RecQ